MMKKRGLFISALIMALSVNAAGAEVISSIHETEEGVAPGMKKVTVEGKIPVTDDDDLIKNAVTFAVFNSGIGIGADNSIDLSQIDKYGDGSQIGYSNQITANEDGTYSFSYTMSAETGNYLIRIGYNGKTENEGSQKIYKYVSPADYINFEKELGEAFDRKDEQGYDSGSKIIELAEVYSDKGILYIPVYEKIKNDEEILKFIGDYILSLAKPEDVEEFSKRFEEGFAVEKLNGKTVDEVKAFFENDEYVKLLNINEEVKSAFYSNEEVLKSAVYSELAEKSQIGKDADTLSNEICDIIVFSEFDDMLWQGNLQVIEKYKNYLGISFDEYNSLSSGAKKNHAMIEFAKGIASLKSTEDVKALFDSSVEKGKKYTAESDKNYSDSKKGSSGGGGGGTVIVAGVSDVTTPSAPKDENKDSVEKIFKDIENYSWAADSIEALAKKNIISGDGAGNFRPGDAVKREEFLKMILVALDLKETDIDVTFDDVTSDKWYYKYIKGGIFYHLIQGVGNDRFGVGNSIKRADAAVIMDRVLKMYGKEYSVKEIVYKDVLKNELEYAFDAIYRVSEAKLMNGTAKTTFEPARSITRAEAAVVIERLIKLLENN